MSDQSLEERLDAVERAVTDGHAVDGLPETARIEARLDDLETAVDDVDDRVAELEAAVQALRGFAGGVRAVDESVERRADAALARVERLEAEFRERDGAQSDDEVVTDSDSGPETDAELAAVAATERDDIAPASEDDSLADRLRRLL